MDEIVKLFLAYGSLAGFAALVTIVINILKLFNVVKEDTATNWSAGLNLLGLIVLMVVKIVNPVVDIAGVDATVASIALMLQVVFAYLVQMGAAKLFYNLIRGIPWIGTSFTLQKEKVSRAMTLAQSQALDEAGK